MSHEQTDNLAVSKKLVVGVDMAKAEFAAGSVWQGQYTYHNKYKNSEQACTGFIAAMEQLQQEKGAEAIHLIIEPTGGYEAQLVSQAYQRQWRVTLVNPVTVRHRQQGRGKRGKADRAQWAPDTQMLTLFGADKNPPAQRPTDDAAAQLDSLLRRKDDLQKLLHNGFNRLEQALRQPKTPKAVQDSIQRTLEALAQELEPIETAVRQLFLDHVALARQLKQLRSAPYLLALLHRFAAKINGTGTAKQLVAFVGLDPPPFESGSSLRQRPTISNQGDAPMRSRLFLCLWAAYAAKTV